MFPCADGSPRQEGHAQRQTLRQKVENFDAGGVPSICTWRGVTLCSAQEGFLEYLWSVIHHHEVVPREQIARTEESSFPIPSTQINVVRQTKTNLDKLVESSIDDIWSIDGNRILSHS